MSNETNESAYTIYYTPTQNYGWVWGSCHNPGAKADLLIAALDWRDALESQAGAEGVGLIEAVIARDKALERAKKALGDGVEKLEALRLWRRVTGVTGVGSLVSKEGAETLRVNGDKVTDVARYPEGV